MRKEIPLWLKKMIGENKAKEHAASSGAVRGGLKEAALHTVCVEAKCPNRGHCFSNGDATFMILGNICTRGCKFCAVGRGCPSQPDAEEAAKIAEMVRKFNIKYVVLTSPTRDDLQDGGAAHFASVIKEIKKTNPGVKTEPLIPDFQGDKGAVKTVLDANPEVLAHNIETVPELYPEVRVGADYKRSLKLLLNSKKLRPDILTKSGIMLGLGETQDQIKNTLDDLRKHQVDLLTMGQYLAPSDRHNLVKAYPRPEEYAYWRDYALSIGFKEAACGPLVRSSYDAGALYTHALINLA